MKSSLMTDFSPSVLFHVSGFLSQRGERRGTSLTQGARGWLDFSHCTARLCSLNALLTGQGTKVTVFHIHSAIYEILQVFPVDQVSRSEGVTLHIRADVTQRSPCPRGEHLSGLLQRTVLHWSLHRKCLDLHPEWYSEHRSEWYKAHLSIFEKIKGFLSAENTALQRVSSRLPGFLCLLFADAQISMFCFKRYIFSVKPLISFLSCTVSVQHLKYIIMSFLCLFESDGHFLFLYWF